MWIITFGITYYRIIPLLPRHFVGILNKTSGQMEVYDAELFNMQPLFAGRFWKCRLS